MTNDGRELALHARMFLEANRATYHAAKEADPRSIEAQSITATFVTLFEGLEKALKEFERTE